MKLQKIIIVFLLIFGSFGCSSEVLAAVQATPTQCLSQTSVSNSGLQDRRPFFVFAFIENTLVYRNSGNINNSQENLQKFFQNNAVPGSHLVLAALSKTAVDGGLNTSVLFDESIETILAAPIITPIPTIIRLVQPTPIPTGSGQVGATLEAEKQKKIDSDFHSAETSVANAYNCASEINERERINAYATLDITRFSEKKKFAEKFSNSFSKLNYTLDEDAKPVFEGLQEAGDFIRDTCSSDFEHCVLLIFSDLKDFREGWAPSYVNVGVNLEGIDVISVLYDCRYNDGECETRMKNWNGHLKYSNAESVTFLLNKDDIVSQLEFSFALLTNKSK